MNKANVLVALADKNFVNQVKQLFSSVFQNSSWGGDYLLLAYNIPEEELIWFKQRGIFIFKCREVNKESEIKESNQVYPGVTLAKFYLFKTYFKNWQKIVFLDSDIIVNYSLDPLLMFDGLAAPNSFSLKMKDQFVLSEKEKGEFEKTYRLDARVFCSGVMVIESSLIENDTFDKIINLHRKYFHLARFGEESVLNLFFYKKWVKLSYIYNFLPERQGLARIKKFAAPIIHFGCCKKPWNEDSSYFKDWDKNLKLANNTDFRKPLVGKEKKWNNFKMFKLIFKVFLGKSFYYIDRQIGIFGIFLKKYLPGFYRYIKNTFGI